MTLSQSHEWQTLGSTVKPVDATLEEFQILYKKYKVKILNNCVNTFLITKDYLKE